MKFDKFGVVLLLVFSLMFIFAIGSTLNAPNVVTPLLGSNLSGSIVLNTTATGVFQVNSTHNNHITNVTFMWINVSGQAFNTTVFNTTANQSTGFVNSSFNTALLVDGRYNLTINVTNSTGSTNATIVANLTIDNTVPAVVINRTDPVLFQGQNFTVTSSNKTFYVNVTDVLSGVANVSLSFDNASGTGFNVLAINNSGEWNASYNVSVLAEGFHTVTVLAYDFAGSLNNTEVFNFTVDNIAPTVTLNEANGLIGGQNFSLNSNNQTFNATIVDANLDIGTVLFWFNNASGNDFNVSTTVNQSGQWIVSYNVSSLAEGTHTVTVIANDTTGNTNSSVSFGTFIYDNGRPIVQLVTGNNTNTSDSSPEIQFNVTDAISVTYNCSVYVNNLLNTTNTSALNVTTNTISFSTLADGRYWFNVNCSDGSGNTNTSERFNITVDATVPVSIINESFGNDNISGQNFTITSNVKTFNVTVNDTLSGVATVIFGFDNASGVGFNLSASNSSGEWNATYNVSALVEGTHTVTVYVTDYAGAVNRTSTYSFTHDNTAPTTSVSCTPTNPEVGQTVTCTCTATDSVSGVQSYSFGDGTTSESLKTSSTGLAGSSVCTATDYTGNSVTATGSWTVVNPAGSSGSSGSTGGVGTKVVGTFAKEVWASVNSGETATVKVENGEIGVTEVNFKVSKTAYGVWLKVEKKTSFPSSVSAFSNKEYKKISITEGNVNKVLDGPAIVKFKVLKSWLTDNSVGKNNVAMFHYDQDAKTWNELKTTIGSADDVYQHYTAETPSFSYFVIGEKTVTAASIAEAVAEEAVAEEAAEEVVAEEITEEVEVTEEAKPTWPWVVLILVVIAIILVAYWLMKRK